MKRILIITGSLFNSLGGPYHSVRDTAVAFLNMGYHVNIIGTKDTKNQEKYVETYVERNKYKNCFVQALRKYGPSNFHFTFGWGKYWTAIKKADYISIQSVWQFNCLLVAIFSIIQRKPYYYAVRGEFNDKKSIHQFHKILIKKLILFAFNKANFIQVLNENEARSLRTYGCTSKINLIPNGINQKKIDISNKRNKHILFLGRLDPNKGLIELINAWKFIKDKNNWKLIIAGDGNKKFKKLFFENIKGQNDIKYLGFISGSKKESLIKNSSWFILPSFMEGMPMAVLESLSYGTPVIITKQCNLPLVFKSGAGFEISNEPKNIAEILQNIFYLEKNDYKQISKNAIKLIKDKYQWKEIIKKIIEQIDE